MKKLTFILLLSVTICTAQPTGYLITVTTTHETTAHRVTTTAAADSILLAAIGQPLKTDSLLKASPFFEFRNMKQLYYCELQKVTRTKTGKLKFSKLKK